MPELLDSNKTSLNKLMNVLPGIRGATSFNINQRDNIKYGTLQYEPDAKSMASEKQEQRRKI